MHPGFVVHNGPKLLEVRAEVGDNYGANFDPSHLFWQNIDALDTLNALLDAEAVFHVHGKDMAFNPRQERLHGVLDARNYGDIRNRSWVFRTIGYGHDEVFWGQMASDLATPKIVGYTAEGKPIPKALYKKGVISIEHEDSLMSANEGFGKAVATLDRVVIREEAGTAHWF